MNLKAGGLGSLGPDQLAWLEQNVQHLTHSTPIESVRVAGEQQRRCDGARRSGTGISRRVQPDRVEVGRGMHLGAVSDVSADDLKLFMQLLQR